MLAGQKLKNSSGNEVILFPLEYLYVTANRPEHDVLALDFLGWDKNGRVYNCPCYAPFSGKIVYTGNDHNMIYQSDEKVVFADGTIDYATILVAHSKEAPQPVGTHYNQGDLWYRTGAFGNVTGDHLHTEIAKGHVKWNASGIGLKNAIHFWNGVYINDTVVVRPDLYIWKIFDGGITPKPQEKKKKFKWVLYARKLRS